MREIKFRFWDGKSMTKSYTLEKLMAEVGNVRFDLGDEIMQYTGLKDKNGREIYEGDVVENNDYKWQITWEEGCVYLKGIGDTKGKWWIGTENPYSEIIGNIYENPELIK